MSNVKQKHWTKREDAILLSTIKASKTRKRGFELASEQLGRTFSACVNRWRKLNADKKKSKKHTAELITPAEFVKTLEPVTKDRSNVVINLNGSEVEINGVVIRGTCEISMDIPS